MAKAAQPDESAAQPARRQATGSEATKARRERRKRMLQRLRASALQQPAEKTGRAEQPKRSTGPAASTAAQPSTELLYISTGTRPDIAFSINY
uniref:Uncharacterized protein n=1 Tax=Bracon brevicornis TaxID=1563983 RepID=A0A6V7LYV7_9HYME